MGVCVMYYLVLVEGGYNPFFVLRELVPLTYPPQPHIQKNHLLFIIQLSRSLHYQYQGVPLSA